MDQFEKNIRDNKEFFDIKAPNRDKMWKAISSKPTQKKTPNKVMWTILLLLIVCLAFFAGKYFNKIQQKQKEPLLLVHAQSTELQAINSHYEKLVSYQIKQLRGNPALDDLEKEDFLKYIDVLSQEQIELKESLASNLDNEEVLDAIIKNFNQQINLIKELLDRVDHTKDINYEEGISL